MSKFTLAAKLKFLRAHLEDNLNAPNLSSDFAADIKTWLNDVASISAELSREPEVVISLLGDSGAGKSTLVNALIQHPILPVSNMRACTAAIAEVSYSDKGHFRAEVDFLPRENWEHEKKALLLDIEEFEQASAESNGEPEVGRQIAKTARDKLRAVYGQEGDKDLDLNRLVEPAEIRDAFDKGYALVEETDWKAFRKSIRAYLDSKSRFWPIVRNIKIQGPFETLSNGVRIVDLPGLDDPNEAREAVTRHHLKSCRYVWAVFNIKRLLKKNQLDLLSSEDFLRQVVMDGRSDALTFIATASDDVSIDAAIDEFDMDDDVEVIEVIRKRNDEATKELGHILSEAAGRMKDLVGDYTRFSTLHDTFLRSKFFAVSAEEFLRLNGMTRAHSKGIEDEDDTQVPQLIEHMNEICRSFGKEAQIDSLSRRVDLIHEEVRQEFRKRQITLTELKKIGEEKKREVQQAAREAQAFLEAKAEGQKEAFLKQINGKQDQLRERIRFHIKDARQNLRVITIRWKGMHWATLRAVCRRDGVFEGSTGRHDLPKDLCNPILNAIAGAWAEFFGEHLTLILQSHSDSLLSAGSSFSQRLSSRLGDVLKENQALQNMLDDQFTSTERLFREMVNHARDRISERIDKDRRELYESIRTQVRNNMRVAFEESAHQAGTGMKVRMISILSDKAEDVQETMFEDAQKEVFDGVRALCDWVVEEANKMVDVVMERASRANEHLRNASDYRPLLVLEEEMEHLTRIADAFVSTAELQNRGKVL